MVELMFGEDEVLTRLEQIKQRLKLYLIVENNV